MPKDKPNWGGYRTDDVIKFRTTTDVVRIPKPYHQACKEHAKQLEDKDVENGTLYQNKDGQWVYRDNTNLND